MTAAAAAALEVPEDLRVVVGEVAATDARETLRRASRLMSRRVGIIRAVGPGVVYAQDPAIFSAGTVTSQLSFSQRISNPGKAGGAGETLEASLASAIGEAVERYSMLFYDKSRMILAAFRDLGEPAVPPGLLRLHSREQVEQRRGGLAFFDDDSRLRWVWGWSLTHDRARLVPAPLVYLGYDDGPGEAVIGSNASTGLAAGLTREAAILSGLYEILERDAFALSWLFRQVRGKVRVDDAELRARMLAAFAMDRAEVSLELFDLTFDLPITSVLAVLRRPAEFGPALCVGAAARLNPRDAVRKSLLELGQGLSYLRVLRAQDKDWAAKEDFSDLTSFDDHLMLYNKNPKMAAEAFAFYDSAPEGLLSSLPNGATGRVKGDVERCVDLLGRAGHEVVVVDLTTPDLRETGFSVVRVLVPGLIPLHGDHSLPYLGVARLREVPWQLGWVARDRDPLAQLNPLPHPFP
ncbi:MAG: YcaO-like family protein [Thermoanaerobaculia bacterium]